MLNMFITGRLRFPTRAGSSPKLPSQLPWSTKRLQAEFQGEPQLSEEVSKLTRHLGAEESTLQTKNHAFGMPAAAIDSKNNFLSGATTSVQNHRTGQATNQPKIYALSNLRIFCARCFKTTPVVVCEDCSMFFCLLIGFCVTPASKHFSNNNNRRLMQMWFG